MVRGLLAASTVCAIAVRSVWAQTVQNYWVFPSLPDNSSTVFQGSKYALSWTSDLADQFSRYCPACDITNVDLWVTGGTTDESVYIVQTGINVQETTSIQWDVDLSDSALSIIQWILRFVPSGASPGSGVGEVSSPRFYIRPASSNPSATTSTTTATPTSTSSPTTTTTTTSAAASSGGLSTGAKAGIGVGVALGVLLIVGAIIGWVILSRKRSKKARSPTMAVEQSTPLNGGAAIEPPTYEAKREFYGDTGAAASVHKSSVMGAANEPQELTASPVAAASGNPQELESRLPLGELDGTSYQSRPAELPTGNTRSP